MSKVPKPYEQVALFIRIRLEAVSIPAGIHRMDEESKRLLLRARSSNPVWMDTVKAKVPAFAFLFFQLGLASNLYILTVASKKLAFLNEIGFTKG
ncbi:hypothetical protein EBB07_20840 [Paenibacillaceae bacterium]|nr:hypothetical protein EBB07_20840 [Paenibacillaceae bacterium]